MATQNEEGVKDSGFFLNYTEVFKYDPRTENILNFADTYELSPRMEEYINFLLAETMVNKMELRTEKDNPLQHLQDEAYLMARMDLLKELKLNSFLYKTGQLFTETTDDSQ